MVYNFFFLDISPPNVPSQNYAEQDSFSCHKQITHPSLYLLYCTLEIPAFRFSSSKLWFTPVLERVRIQDPWLAVQILCSKWMSFFYWLQILTVFPARDFPHNIRGLSSLTRCQCFPPHVNSSYSCIFINMFSSFSLPPKSHFLNPPNTVRVIPCKATETLIRLEK